MKTKPKKRGGVRLNAGAKTKEDKKIQVPIGIKESHIKILGGGNNCKEIMKEAINNALLCDTDYLN